VDAAKRAEFQARSRHYRADNPLHTAAELQGVMHLRNDELKRMLRACG
tara:strand:+ start:1115 stop:1258 length:144 start_codon:yes stop_codon:yes gene_type:complete